MPDKTYRLSIGDIKITIFSDGYLQDPEEQFGLNVLYIEAGTHKMLLDNGCGVTFQEGTAGNLLKNLKSAGIKPGDVDTIIFDHGHLDHVCGTTDEKGKPIFPNARYIITKKEWDYILAGPTDNKTQNDFYTPARKYLVPMEDSFELVGDNYEVLPGIKFVPAHGHTRGNSMVDFSSSGQHLLSVGDMVHSQKEFTEPAHCAAFDVDSDEAIKTRSKILAKLAKDGTFVFATHFAFPGLGHFREKKGVISWEAIK